MTTKVKCEGFDDVVGSCPNYTTPTLPGKPAFCRLHDRGFIPRRKSPGRPATGKKGLTVAVYISEDNAEYLDTKSKQSGLSRSAIVNQALLLVRAKEVETIAMFNEQFNPAQLDLPLEFDDDTAPIA